HRWSGGRPTDAPDRRDGADHGNHRRPAHPHGDRCSDTGSGRAPDGTGPPIHDDTAARPEHYTTGGTGTATVGGGSWQPESARPLSRLPDPVTGGSNRVRENWGKVRARVQALSTPTKRFGGRK